MHQPLQQPQAQAPQQPQSDDGANGGHSIKPDVAGNNEARKRQRFGREAMQARKSAAAERLREDRGMAQPEPSKPSQDGGDPGKQEAVDEAKPKSAEPKEAAPKSADPTVAQMDAQLQSKQRELAAAEARVKEAHTAAEKRAAEAEAREASAQKKLTELEFATAHPLEMMEKLGMSEAEFRNFLAAGGKFTAEQLRLRTAEKSVRDLEARLNEMAEQTKAERSAMFEEMEAARFEGKLSQYTLVPLMGGIDAVKSRAALLSKQLGQKVSYEDAANSLEREFEGGVGNLLKNEAVRKKFLLDAANVEKPKAGKADSSPRTLNSQMASSTSASERKAHPMDMAARKRLLKQKLEAGLL